MRLVVFLHGTVLMHRGAAGLRRPEIVAQVRDTTDPTVLDFGSYVPVGNAAAKLRSWQEQGAEIGYLTSHRDQAGIAADTAVLARHGFPPGPVHARTAGESYGDVIGRLVPDVLIEDDCESIGANEIAYPQVAEAVRHRVGSIVVPDFGGIDGLPDSLADLLAYAHPDP